MCVTMFGSAMERPSTPTSPTPVAAGIELVSAATTRRGLYVGVTLGRDENLIFVITESDDVAEARDVLDGILAVDRADIPAVTQRRNLATQHRQCRRPRRRHRVSRVAVRSRTGSPDCSPTPDTLSVKPSTPSNRVQPSERDVQLPSPQRRVISRTSIGRRLLTARGSPLTRNEPTRPGRPTQRRSGASPAVVGGAGARLAVNSTSPNVSSSGPKWGSNEPGNGQRPT